MLLNDDTLCSVIRTVDFKRHHLDYTLKSMDNHIKNGVELSTRVKKIFTEKNWFFQQNGFRTLVLSKSSFDSLDNFIVPKNIRVNVLKTLPNRKDIIQIDSQNCIQYIKTDEKVILVSYFRQTNPNGHNVYHTDFLIHTHFITIDLITGDVIYDENDTYTNVIFKTQNEVIEKYYSRFMVIVTYLELTEINLEIVYGKLNKHRKTNINIKNNSRFDVIRVTSKWNTYTLNLSTIDVRGHWRLQPYGTGRSKYKYIWIDSFQKGITKRRPQKELV